MTRKISYASLLFWITPKSHLSKSKRARIFYWHSQCILLEDTQPSLTKIVILRCDASLVWLLIHPHYLYPIPLPYGASDVLCPVCAVAHPFFTAFHTVFPAPVCMTEGKVTCLILGR